MIIVLKGADFSENNLGQVEVDINPNEYTTAALSAGGRTGLNNNQISSLNNFFNVIGAGEVDSIASKIRYLFMPILAGNVSKALINYKNENFTVEATPSATNWVLSTKGIKGVDTTGTGNIQLTLTEPIIQNNACLIYFQGEAETGTSNHQNHFLSLRGKQNDSKWLSSYRYGSNYGGLPNQWWGGGISETIPSVMGYNLPSTGNGQRCVKDVISAGTTTPAVDMSDQTSQTVYVFGANTKNNIPASFAMLSESLTAEQFTNVINAVIRVRNAFVLD